MSKKLQKLLSAIGLMSAAAASQAAIDVSAVTTAVGDAGTAATTVGGAVLVVMVTIGVFIWLRRPLK